MKPIDLDVLNSSEFEFCVRCYASEGAYSEQPCRLIVNGNAKYDHVMKLPHFGRKMIVDGQ